VEVVRSGRRRTGRILGKWLQAGTTSAHRSIQSWHSQLPVLVLVLLVLVLVVVCLPAGCAAPARSLVCTNGFLLRSGLVSTQNDS
jgi:hypothetical protein